MGDLERPRPKSANDLMALSLYLYFNVIRVGCAFISDCIGFLLLL